MAIKDIIYKAAKKISTTTDLDITPEELANLTLYKVMNLPYFEGCNDFLTLHYNVFNEIALGHTALNALKGYTNGSLNSFVVIMDKTDTIDSKIKHTSKILKESDSEVLKAFLNIVENSKSIKEIVEKITAIEEKDPIFLNKILNITGTGDHYGNPLMKGLTEAVEYKAEGSQEEYKFKEQSKNDYYRSVRSLRDLSDVVFSSYAIKKLANEKLEKVIETLETHELEKFTGVAGLKKEHLNKFHKTHPEEYEKSLYKIFKENDDLKSRCLLAFDLYKLEDGARNVIETSKKILKNKTAEDLLDTYKNYIDPILTLVEKKYPQLKDTVDNSGYEIKTLIYKTEDEREKFIDTESPLEIYQEEYSSINYPSVRGNSFYKAFYRSNEGIYIAANNGLEDIVGGEGYLRSETRAGGYSIPMENIRLNRIYEAGRDANFAIKKDVIEAFVKMAEEKQIIFVHDIIERNHKAESKFNNDMFRATTELQEKYPHVIFLYDGYSYDDGERLRNEIKAELVAELNANDAPYAKIISSYNKIEQFFKTEDFEKVLKMDRFERKTDEIIAKAKQAAMADTPELNKNKRKVSL